MLNAELYEKIYTARTKVNSRVLDFLPDTALKRAGKFLGLLGKNEVFIFDDEEDASKVMYFAAREIRTDGKSAVDHALEADIGENEHEKEFLKGLSLSYSSLFEVTNTNPEAGCVNCRDLLKQEESILEINDIGFSQSAKVAALIFLIVIPVYGGFIGNGISFIFDPKFKELILKECNNLSNREIYSNSAKRFRLFFKLNRKMGAPILYR